MCQRVVLAGWNGHITLMKAYSKFQNMKQLEKTKRFCEEYELAIPIIMAPMAGAGPPALAAAVGSAGGVGATFQRRYGRHQDRTRGFVGYTIIEDRDDEVCF